MDKNFHFYVLNHLLPACFIFYALFLIKRENTQYQLNILRNNSELQRYNLEIQKKNEVIDEKVKLLQQQKDIIDEKARLLQKQTSLLAFNSAINNRPIKNIGWQNF